MGEADDDGKEHLAFTIQYLCAPAPLPTGEALDSLAKIYGVRRGRDEGDEELLARVECAAREQK